MIVTVIVTAIMIFNPGLWACQVGWTCRHNYTQAKWNTVEPSKVWCKYYNLLYLKDIQNKVFNI